MTAATAFRFSQGFYWLFLGIWVGAMVMLVIGAIATFRTVREYKPSLGLPPYNHPALAENAPGILAGAVTGNVLKGLRVLQIVCALVVAVCVVLQCTVFADYLRGGVAGGLNIVRILLLALPILVLVVDCLVVTPRVWEQRRVMYDPVLTVEQRDSARVVFQRYHKMSERVVGLAMLSLAAAVFVSAFLFETSGIPREPGRLGPGTPGVSRGTDAGKDVGGG